MKKIKLGNITKITSGGTPNRKVNEYFDNGNIPWIKTGDLKPKDLFEAAEYITQEGLKNSSAKLFPPKTVLIALYGATIGACSILRIEASTNQACAAILPTSELNEEYLYYYLSSIKDDLIKMGVGGAQPNISGEIVKNIEIPLPPLPEQQRIVALLDKADCLRQKRRQSLALMDEFLKSTFLDMFGDPVKNEKGWEMKPLDEIVAADCPLTYGIVQPGLDFPHGIPVVRPIDLTQTYVSRNGLKLIDPIISGQFKRTVLKGDEILMSVRGTTGLVSIASRELEGCNVTRGITPMWFCSDYNLYFAYNLMQSQAFKDKIKEHTYGATLQQINLSVLRKIKIITPPIYLQNQFANIFEKTEQAKEKMKAQLVEMDNNFNGLMAGVFKR